MNPFALWRLERELALWRAAGHTPRLWWRDDDAREPTPALDRLLLILDGAPVALAVIPDGNLGRLAERLLQARGVTISQHGADHINRRPVGTSAGEYPEATPAVEIAARVGAGRDRLADHGLAPRFYTPPWNRLDEHLPAALVMAGFDSLSAWSDQGPRPGGLRRLDTHLDVLRWRGGPRFRGGGAFLEALRQQLILRRRAGAEAAPIGVLTHHLVHDDACWAFLARFTPYARKHFAWRDFAALTV
ncbi:MAG: DUF2334 domain-containing protein [Caulobacter sp.]|nr:DUF2334 domain-containing protein [Caulobacter sp.]